MSDISSFTVVAGEWRMVGLGLGILVILLTVLLMHNEKIRPKFGVPWIIVGLVIVFGLPVALRVMASGWFGILSLLGGLLLLVLFPLTVWASGHERHIRNLAQEHAILEAYLRRKTRHYGADL